MRRVVRVLTAVGARCWSPWPRDSPRHSLLDQLTDSRQSGCQLPKIPEPQGCFSDVAVDTDTWAPLRVPRDHGSRNEAVHLCEHEAESVLGAEQVDLALQVGPERGVVDLVEKNVEFASHVIS